MANSTYELIENINEMVRRHIDENMTQTNAEALGLDPRAAYKLFVDDRTIAVDKYMDKSLQYYGGFEYIDKEFRSVMGDYVFYHIDEEESDHDEDTGEEFYSCRVGECLNKFSSLHKK